MRHAAVVLAVGFALALGDRAEAQVVTFDELAPTANLILGSVVCSETGSGFRFSSDHFHLIGTDSTAFADFTYNGTSHLGYESGRGFPITLERLGGGTFSLISLDAAEFYSHVFPDRPDAQILTIVGYQPGGGTVTHTVNLDGIADGAGGAVDFQHFVLPGTFVNLTSVVFTGLRNDGQAGGMAIDNLEYQLAVPETLGPCVVTPLPPETPVVAITNPTAGNVSGTVLVQATATDNLAVVGVQFKIDGVPLGAEDTVAPYDVPWDTTTVVDGSYTITAEARDVTNNIGVASVVVTVHNAPVVPATPHYLDFDGLNDYATIADAPALSFGTGTADTPLTFEMWLRPDLQTSRYQILGKWGETSNQEYRLFIVSNTIRLDLRDQSAAATTSAYAPLPAAGAWHHLAVTYDGRGGPTAAAGIAFYLDGVAVPVTPLNHAAYVAMENLAAPLVLGRESPGYRQYDGGLDDLRLWNVARSAQDIQASLNAELTGLEPGLAAYWPFNDGTGTTSADASSANNPVTLYNGLVWGAGGPLVTP